MKTAGSLHALAALYFDSEVPHELETYLIDRCHDEPLEGAWDPQQLSECIHEDIRTYPAGQPDTTVRTPFQKLEERYGQLSHFTSHLADGNRKMDFLMERNLTGVSVDFREHAGLKSDELGPMRYAL